MSEKFLPRNVHPVERGIRVLLGLFLLSLIFWGPQTLFGLVGVIPLVTGLVGSCPLYTLLHRGTVKLETHSVKSGS